MQQVQKQIVSQNLTLSQAMQTSLVLLQKDPTEIAREVVAESRRNPFLKLPPGTLGRVASRIVGDGPVAEQSAQTETAVEKLLRQVGLIRFEKTQAQLARDLVYCLDDRGFLTDSPDSLCRLLGVGEAMLENTISELQSSLEPTGVFARSLAECFRLQLIEKNRFDPMIASLLNRLDLIARQDIPAICKHCGTDSEDARDMLEDIRALNPAPLVTLHSPGQPLRKPDLIASLDVNGRVQVQLNADALPDVLTDDALFSDLKCAETDGMALMYYKDCYSTAASYVTALQKRANTLLRVGQHIAGIQGRFLKTGHLPDRVPLSMETTARALGLNKSTVSRAMAGCLIETPHGIISAADFFVRAFSDKSSHRTRDQFLKRLDLLIRTEDKTAPLSDQALSHLMCRANFAMSRRTVTKYRNLIGHPCASARRER